MKKLTRNEMKEIMGAVGGGGSGPVNCIFISASCGNLGCMDVSQPTGPLPGVKTCTAYLAYLKPSCNYTTHSC